MYREIVEITDRAIQGITLPFKCIDNEQTLYFVKGKGAGNNSLIAEFVASHLAVKFGLPVAPFEVLYIPECLIECNSRPDIGELGAGMAFGSRAIPHVQELSISLLEKVPQADRRDLVVFDWWIKNADRTLGIWGGNPNLLWDVTSEHLVVIDHNQAFDSNFNPRDFLQTHVFKDDFINVTSDMIERIRYTDRLSAVFETLDEVCDNIPEEWWWVDHGVKATFDLHWVKNVLSTFSDDNFWRIA